MRHQTPLWRPRKRGRQRGVTPLHASARRDGVSVVQVLLDHRADVGAQDRGGDTPLHRAASGDAAAAAALLLDRDGDLSAGAHDGVTPLHVAALKDAGRVARVLPSHGGTSWRVRTTV